MFVVCLTDSSLPIIMTRLVQLSITGALFLISFRGFLTFDILIGRTFSNMSFVFFCEGVGLGV